MTKRNDGTPNPTRMLQIRNKVPPMTIDPKPISKNRSDQECEASAHNGQDNEQAVGMTKADDQRLSIVGAAGAPSRGRCGTGTKTSKHLCGVRIGTGGGSLALGRSRTCRRGYCARGGNIHSLRILSSTGIICQASALAGRIVVWAGCLALPSILLAFMKWDGQGVLGSVWLLAVAAKAYICQGVL